MKSLSHSKSITFWHTQTVKKTLVALKLSLTVIQPRSKYFNEMKDEKLYKKFAMICTNCLFVYEYKIYTLYFGCGVNFENVICN